MPIQMDIRANDMHIAFNGWFWNQQKVGSGQYLRHLLTHLRQLDARLQLTLVLPSEIGEVNDIPPGVTGIYAPARLPGNLGKVWFEQRAFPAALRRLTPDIAHVPYWASPFNSRPARLVTSVLDIIPLLDSAYRRGLGVKLYTSLVTTTARGSAQIITLSESSKQDIIDHLKIPTERITATYLAADDRFHPKGDAAQDEQVRKKYDLPDDFVLYFGGFDLRKNVNTLLLAWTYAGPSLGEQMPLVLAGRPPAVWDNRLFPDLPDYAKKLNIGRYLMWLGEVDEADKPTLYRLAKLVVFPSRYEGFGLPLLEAMASGTPTVACNISSIPEVVGDAAYLVPPDDARQMGAAILSIIVQPDLHANLANAGRGRASGFSWRKTAQQTLEVYEKAMRMA